MNERVELSLPIGPDYPCRTFEEGDIIFSQGERGEEMFLVRSGSISIECHGKAVAKIGPGEVFGEMALIDGSVRSGTARALRRSVLAPINERAFLYLIQETPCFALQLMRLLSARLRRANQRR